jgi:malonyl-CoA/methylmalonyl-CoA synthetase
MESEISYGQLDRDSNGVVNLFRDLGVRKGDRVILFLRKSLFFVTAHIALQKMGAIGVPLNPGFKKSEMSYFIGDTGAKLVVLEPEREDMIREIDPDVARLVIDASKPYRDIDVFSPAETAPDPVDLQPADTGLLIYTSGTTGTPKGAVLTQGNLVHDAKKIIGAWQISESDVLCHTLPLFHVHGLCFALHTCLLAGASILMLDQFSPGAVLDLLENKEGDYPCTLFMAVPSIYTRLINHIGGRKPDFGHMRLWTAGSAPLLSKDFKKIADVFGREPVEREGMTETGMNFSNPLRGVRKPGSIGLPLPGLRVRIVDTSSLRDVEPGQVGEIWLKGPGITPGYWKKAEETAKVFADGWFRTGDLGRVDEEGYYYLTDRLKHIIISGGENISPKEIEGVINRLADVAESSVVGLPDREWGEKVVAAVVVKPGSSLNPDAVQLHCREHLHNWKCPKKILFVGELPKNTMGKVLKDKVQGLFDQPGE